MFQDCFESDRCFNEESTELQILTESGQIMRMVLETQRKNIGQVNMKMQNESTCKLYLVTVGMIIHDEWVYRQRSEAYDYDN